jgi:Spy/CpxP family protein refolding chaperone
VLALDVLVAPDELVLDVLAPAPVVPLLPPPHATGARATTTTTTNAAPKDPIERVDMAAAQRCAPAPSSGTGSFDERGRRACDRDRTARLMLGRPTFTADCDRHGPRPRALVASIFRKTNQEAHMRRMRGAGLGLALCATLAVGGCDEKTDAPGATSTATAAVTASAAPKPATTAAASASGATSAAAAVADTSVADGEKAAADLKHHHHHHHHGGVTMFIHMAIDSLGVSPETKAKLEKIQADLHAKMAPSREAGRAVLQLLADGVAAGTIDKGKVDAALAKQATASAGVHAATQDALNQLHEALSPAERGALVDKVRAHAEVWKKANHDEEYGSKEKGTHLGKLTADLSLTPDQVEKISAALKKDAPPKPDPAAIDAHLKAFETAFVADKFDAKTLATTANAANAHISKHGSARIARFYEIVTPLLTPEQRTKLAEHLKERLNDPHAAK